MSGKDATIESLNGRIATLEVDKADLTTKLISVPKSQTDVEEAEARNRLVKARDDLQRQLQAMQVIQVEAVSDQQRMAFEDALRYSIQRGEISLYSVIDVYRESRTKQEGE
jgi:hypothetical protein